MREPAQGQNIAGKYRIESLIGHGGMGSVWRARHESLDMPVAIKFMGAHAGGDPEARQRFEREARALASLRTPNIVQVLDHGVDDETPYIVMELLEGEDLSTRMARKRRISLDETSRILAQVARALRRAHEAGVTHRDLKPSNIFLAQVDGDEIVKVLDFGVAKLAAVGALGDQLTKTGTLLGSPGYMSPEQARGKEVDFRSDLWALAVIVFRAVTGVKPFAGDSIAELVIKLCIDPRPVATRLAGDLPPAIDRFFEKAFAAEPQDRFSSAVEMASAFAQAIGQPGLELSRSGPSPISRNMASRVDLNAPALPPSAIATTLGFPSPAAIAPPSTGTGVLPPPRGPGQAATMVLVPAPSPSTSGAHAAAMREPTPTPGSFGGFAPTAAETGSIAPAPAPLDPGTSSFPLGTRAPSFPASPTSSSPSFVAAPAIATAPSSAISTTPPAQPALGSPLNSSTPRSNDAPTPMGMRLHAPGSPVNPDAAARPAGSPPYGPQGSGPGNAGPGGAPRVDPKILAFAAAGAAVLAIFFALAISGLRRRHANASIPNDDVPGIPTTMATLTAPEDTAAPATTTAPIALDPSASASAPAPDPSATSTASSTDPGAGPTIVEAPVTDAPTATATATTPAPTATTPAPKPTTTTHNVGPRTSPTTKSTGKTAPTGSGKKKTTKPNFGY